MQPVHCIQKKPDAEYIEHALIKKEMLRLKKKYISPLKMLLVYTLSNKIHEMSLNIRQGHWKKDSNNDWKHL